MSENVAEPPMEREWPFEQCSLDGTSKTVNENITEAWTRSVRGPDRREQSMPRGPQRRGGVHRGRPALWNPGQPFKR